MTKRKTVRGEMCLLRSSSPFSFGRLEKERLFFLEIFGNDLVTLNP